MVSLLFVTKTAQCQSSQDPARTTFERGMTALSDRRFGEAIGELEASYAIDPDNGVLFNLAIAYRAAGRTLEAIHAFERFRANARSELSPERARAIDDTVATLRANLGTIQLQIHPPMSSWLMRVDGQLMETAGGFVQVAPGRHALEVNVSGHRPWYGSVVVVPRGAATVSVAPTMLSGSDLLPSVRSALAPAPVSIGSPWWAWTLLGAVIGGGVAVTVYFGVVQ
jgi:hypothetical protein